MATTRAQRKSGRLAAKAAAKGRGQAAKAGKKIAASPLGTKAAKPAGKVTAYLTEGAVANKAREVATQVGPASQRAGEVAAQSLRDARVWAAPRLDSAADAVTGTVAPKVAAALKATARRVQPRPQRSWMARTLTDWRVMLAGAAGVVTAAGAVAVYLRRRGEPLVKPVSGSQQEADGSAAADSSTSANLGSK